MALSTGVRLGPYEIERLLGAGGMGEVYRGVDTRLGRAVALKVISPRLIGDGPSRRRFETEARAASGLNHPAIVTIYDIGETDGLSWIAMELVEGRTLRDAIAQGPMPVRQAWSIARLLADGLAAAHARGVVHRDLKPENVMLTDEGGVKILDFGIARQVVADTPGGPESADTVTAAGTIDGTILGTAGYMSPEQATGSTADARSDQFSFGAVVYELLSARRAFQRPTALETLTAILRDQPDPLAPIRPDVSGDFQQLIGRCLEKSPAQRFASTRELAAALEALTPEASATAAPGEPVLAGGYPPRPARLARPGRLAALLAGAALAALATGAFIWNRWPGARLPAIDSVAVLPFANTANDPDVDYVADGLTEGLIDHLSRAASLKVKSRATVMRFKDRDPQEAARALGVSAVVTGALSRRGDQFVITAELIQGATGQRLWGQTFDRPAADLMRVQDSIVMSIAEGLRLRLSGDEKARLGGFATANPEAYELFLKGRFLLQKDTEEDDLEARKLFVRAVDKDPKFLDAHLAIASTYARSGGSGYMPAREAMALADAALETAAAIDPNSLAVRVAMAHREFTVKHDWAAAERLYRAVMHEPEVLRTVQYHPIALFFVAIGRPDDAVTLVRRALEVDPDNSESKVMLGNFLLQAGRLDEAMRAYEAVAAEAPDDPRPHFGIADVHKRRGDYARASASRRKAYELYGDDEAAGAFAGATTEAAYARAELTVARAELLMLEARAKERYIPALDFGRVHAQIGNREQALTWLERAFDEGHGTDVGLVLLKADQAWEPVRADPRFVEIVRRMGIP